MNADRDAYLNFTWAEVIPKELIK